MTTPRPRSVHDLDWPRSTGRLRLRPATPGDLEATWCFRQREDVCRWLTHAPASLAEYRDWYLDAHTLDKSLVIELAGEVIGDVMFQIEDAWAQAEIVEQARCVQAELGWVMHPDYGGRGYATEAVRELLRIGFEDLGLRRMTANCFIANESSWRLMGRVGMRLESHAVRESLHRSGDWLDVVGYAILAEDYHRNATQVPA